MRGWFQETGLWEHARIWPLHLQPGQIFDCIYIHALSDLCSTLKLMDSPLIQALVWLKWECTRAKPFGLVTTDVISLSMKVEQLSNGLT